MIEDLKDAIWYLEHIDWREVLGFLAALLVFLTFFSKDMVRLRHIAIMSNVAFIAYAITRDLHPIFVLHAVLLPLNIIRLRQWRRQQRELEAAEASS